jgi:hypothetical protein
LGLTGRVDGKRSKAKGFQFDRSTKLPVMTTHSYDMRLYLVDGFTSEVFDNRKWFLSERGVWVPYDRRL